MQPSKEQVRVYYEDHFNRRARLELARVINADLDDFDRREFAWMLFPDETRTAKDNFKRNFHFDTMDDLMRVVVKLAPYKFYFGAVYAKKWDGSIKRARWQRNEIHFDFDINESEQSRKGLCDCGKAKGKEEKKKVCDKCFEIVKETAIFVIDTLHEDFGIDRKGVMAYFSGTRGIHLHYPAVSNLGTDEEDDKEIRRDMCTYISLVNEETTKDDNGKTSILAKIDGMMGARSLLDRADKLVYKWFFLNSPENILKKVNIMDSAKQIIIDGLRRGKGMTKILEEYMIKANRPLMTDRQIKRVRELALSCRYPRIDGTPTFDVRKVIKVPFSVDCNTGYIVTRIKNIEGFTLGDIDRIENHVSAKE